MDKQQKVEEPFGVDLLVAIPLESVDLSGGPGQNTKCKTGAPPVTTVETDD